MQKKVSIKELRKFGIFVGTTIPLFIGWIIPLINGHTFSQWTLFIGLPLVILGIIKPKSLLLIYEFWIKLGYFLGFINSHLILGFVFIIILQPIAFIMRLFKYDPLKINRLNKETYKENNEYKKIDLERIF
tara:strand:- start:119 stop:511 length:393 start_codon:yes stop_codon:yes gene_type:complete